MTSDEFYTIMSYLEAGSGTGKKATQAQFEVYFDILGALPYGVVKQAARQALAESEYPTIPPVGALLRLAGGATISTDNRALVAYAAAARAARRLSAYRSLSFDDPLVNATIRALGGWERFCDWPTADVHWRQRDFERHYAALTQAGIAGELAAPLVGICDRDNLAGGFVEFLGQTTLVKCGLPAQRTGLVTGEIPKPLCACTERQKRISQVVQATASILAAPLTKYTRKIACDPARPERVETEAEFEARKAAIIAENRRRLAIREMTVDDLIAAGATQP